MLMPIWAQKPQKLELNARTPRPRLSFLKLSCAINLPFTDLDEVPKVKELVSMLDAA